MNEIITVNFDNETLSARELHKAVGSTERFANWFDRQLQYGFEEGSDYLGCKTFNTLAKQELQDYDLSIDMAKQICMVQKNENAKKIRHYLIELEKAWNTPDQVMARALKMADKTIKSLEQKIEEQKPLVAFANKVSDSSNLIDMGKMAKLLKDEHIKIGRNRLFEWLRRKEILMKNNVPYQRYIDGGYFEVKESVYETAYGSKTNITTFVTGKGQIYLTEKLRKEFGEAV
jgi:anti-repressor protein